MQQGITVYCASASDIPQVYIDAARALGRAIAGAGVPLITGGGKMGLMEAVNSACLQAGGTAIGVLPQFMVERGWAHPGLTEMIPTPDMHARKHTMASLARAAIALPGGVGTFEELLEIITWRQLHLFDGRVVICNIDGYYDPLLRMIDRAQAEGFLSSAHRDHPTLFEVASAPEEAVALALGED